jgi:hypothetical protein
VSPETDMILEVLLLALAGHPVAGSVTCEKGRLVTVRTLERSEGPAGGPSPAAPDERSPSPGRGALHLLTFRCGDRTFEASIPDGAPDLRREDLRPRDDVAFRVDGGTLYLKRRDGTRLRLHLSAPHPDADAKEERPSPD